MKNSRSKASETPYRQSQTDQRIAEEIQVNERDKVALRLEITRRPVQPKR